MNVFAFQTSRPIESVIGSLEVRTSLSPPVKFTDAEVSDLIQGRGVTDPQTSALLKILKPTVLLNSPVLGQTTIAPYGVSGPDDWQAGQGYLALGVLLSLAAAFGVGYAVRGKGSRGRR